MLHSLFLANIYYFEQFSIDYKKFISFNQLHSISFCKYLFNQLPTIVYISFHCKWLSDPVDIKA